MTRDAVSLAEQFDRAIARVESGVIVVTDLLALLARARAELVAHSPALDQWAVPDPQTGEWANTPDPASRALDALDAIDRYSWH